MVATFKTGSLTYVWPYLIVLGHLHTAYAKLFRLRVALTRLLKSNPMILPGLAPGRLSGTLF